MRNEFEQATGGKFVGAVENAITILRHLAHAARPQGVAPIARATALNVSTTFNILRTLTKEGLVAFDTVTKTYCISIGVLEFSAPLVGSDQVDLIRPHLKRLSQEHKSLICLWKVTPNDRIVLVDRMVGTNIVRIDMSIGARLPAFIGAVGRCIAAMRKLDDAQLETHFKRLRWQNPPSFETYAAEVRQANERGYAFDYGQLFTGVDIVASVVCDQADRVRFGISGISLAGILSRDELNGLGEAIRDIAGHISSNFYGRASENARRWQEDIRPARAG